MKFSQKEISDLLISWIVLSVAFVLFTRSTNPVFIPQMFFIVGTAFGLHELSHKYVAQSYGLWSEYRKWNFGLLLALLFGLLAYFSGRGILFAAPGAVMIMSTGWITPEIEAKTSIAGPLANIAVGAVAVLIRAVGLFYGFLTYLAMINFLLAVFNLLPFPPFDGSTVLRYNFVMWVSAFAVALVGLGVIMFV